MPSLSKALLLGASVVNVASATTDAQSQFFNNLAEHLESLPHSRLLSESDVPSLAPTYAGSVKDASQTSSMVKVSGFEVYSETVSMRVVQTLERLPFNGTDNQLNMSTILAVNKSYLILSERCQPLPDEDKFAPMYGWLKYAKNLGNMTIDDRACTSYGLTVPTENVSLALCIDAETGRLPVSFNVTSPLYQTKSIYGADIHETLTSSDEALLQIPDQCLEPPPICDGGEVTELDVYIFHPANQFDLYNEDVADLLGDTAFICSDAASGHTDSDAYEWVSRYSLQVWSGWGDYGECNRPSPHEEGVCISFEDYAVGREASFGLKPKGGQCVDNSDIGSWYSLPKDGMCQNDTQTLGPKGDGNCSWRVVEKLKTINGTCLLKDQGMLNSCLSETSLPFKKTQYVLFNAFNETDPAKGGCPDISK